MLFRCWETSELHHNRSEQLCPLLAIGRHRCTKRQAQRGNARVGDGLANLNPKPDHNRHGKNMTCSLISLYSGHVHPMGDAGTGLTCDLARQATMEGISVSVIHHVLLEHIPKTLHASVLAKFLNIASNTFTENMCTGEVALARKT